MTEIDSSSAQSAVQEQSVTVPQGHNTLVMSLRDHSWVSIPAEIKRLPATIHPPQASVCRSLPELTLSGQMESLSGSESEVIQPIFSPLEQLQQGLPAQLLLTSDAPDQHIVDGVGEIPANGTSFCTITIEAVALDGTPLTGQAQQSEVFLRTTGGVLLDAAGENRLRSVTLKSGRAAFRWFRRPARRW